MFHLIMALLLAGLIRYDEDGGGEPSLRDSVRNIYDTDGANDGHISYGEPSGPRAGSRPAGITGWGKTAR